ncbi:FAD-dependent oxidoreductase [Roseimaritima ulvae]|uniref:FAD/NAD(P)-binding domain-containing protein n=1 Tax=Roseimaritima ulvae TaxID=980254 RepID=A0A5B9QYA1_9BACT|nr:FAD-dependent oxidoreductase [Roseimaritima ulvae]QEG42879.1 hypothetical protein UC8_49210 [Roseimaritima ulvae]
MSDEILEAPGSIAIIGGGVLGLETALYARFLGYEVQLLEASEVGQRWLDEGDAPLQFLPGRGISELALAAIRAQSDDSQALQTLPTTAADWANQILRPLAEIDLLAGRVHCGHRVVDVRRVPNEEDPEEFDFQIHCQGQDTVWQAEAVVDTAGWSADSDAPEGFAQWSAVPYFCCIDGHDSAAGDEDWEARSRRGRDQIRQRFATWGDRPTLDLYRPRRS